MRNLQQPVCWPPSLSKYFLIANREGTEKINGHPDFDYNEDSVKVLKSPKGTTFVIPNTGGTKAYDAIYGYSLEHIKAVRPKLSWLTQAQLEHYDYLFEKGSRTAPNALKQSTKIGAIPVNKILSCTELRGIVRPERFAKYRAI